MENFEPKSRPLWFPFTVAFVSLVLVLVVGVFIISQMTFTKNLDDMIDIQVDVINNQILNNFEIYTNDIISTSNHLEAQLTNLDLSIEDDKDEALNIVETMILLNQNFSSISVYNNDGYKLLSNSYDETEDYVDPRTNWFNLAKLDSTTHHFSTPFYDEGKHEIILSKYVPINKYKEYIILKMKIDFKSVINLVSKADVGSGGHITIIDGNYDYVYTSNINNSIDKKLELSLFKELILGSSMRKINDKQMAFVINTVTNTTWRLGVFININRNYVVKTNYITTTILFSSIFIILSSFTFYYVSKGISKPLNRLKDVMSNIDLKEGLDLNTIEVNYPKEVEILSYNFKNMMIRIDELMNTVIKEQVAQRKSELKALQNQINPHFLYNTLDSIVWMVENKENEDAIKMILALSKLFKISISDGKNIISVTSELEHAKNYLLIQKMRYKDNFKFNINILNDEVLKMDTMKLILQPLIENAIYHGIEKLNNDGVIDINVSYVDELLRFEVTDNGYGMTKDKIQDLYKILDNDNLHDGVGLKNIYQRLKVYYGPKASLQITSVPDEGTTITILIPAGDLL